MEEHTHWETDSHGSMTGLGLHDGYLYGLIQEGTGLVIYAKTSDGESRNVHLMGLKEMNVTDFWIGSIVGDIYLWPVNDAPISMWEKLFAGRIALHTHEDKLRMLIEGARGRYFFALEGSYGCNIYAVCDEVGV